MGIRPSISVIIPVYNTKNYLLQCLDSVLAQIEETDEVIIIDDGSTDGSEEVCEKCKEANENIIFFRQKNAGLGCVRNRGLQEASKEYVIFLDSDDYWEKDTVITLKNSLQEKKVDILYFDAKCIYDDIVLEQRLEFNKDRYNRAGHISTEIFSGQTFFKTTYPLYFNVSACMVAFRREFLIEHNIFFQEGVYFEDNVFSFKAALEADLVQYIPKQLYLRRYRYESIMTSKVNLKKLGDYVYIEQEICKYILQTKHRYSGNVLWKMYYFAYKILEDFHSMCGQYTGNANEINEMEREIYKSIFSLMKNEKTDENIAIGVFLNLLMEIKSKGYAEELIRESFADNLGTEISLNQIYDIYQRRYKKCIDKKLQKLPIFQQNVRVGLYGAGQYTKSLLQECKKIGDITDDILILDSYLGKDQEYLESYPIVNVKDVDNRVEVVIISSYYYEEKMLEMARKYLNKNIEIILLHEDEMGPICWRHIY